jgi:fructokinase
MTPHLVDPAAFEDAPCLHLCSNSLTHEPARGATLRALDLAHQHGCPVSLDINWRPGLWPAGAQARSVLWPLLRQAHVLKFSAEEWDWLDSGGDLARHCFDGKAELLVVTDGPRPVRTLTRHGAATHAVPSCAAVDTTAAGDAFVAGLLYRLCAQDLGPEELAGHVRDAAWLAQQVAFAARCGARACMSYGAFAALPALAEVSAAA